jgi:sodium-independent sulfate anion transporter 11
MSLFSFQLLSQVKIGPKDGTQLTRVQRVINKSLWLIGTARNAILVVICGSIGYALDGTDAIRLTGKYHVHAFYSYSHFTAQDKLF